MDSWNKMILDRTDIQEGMLSKQYNNNIGKSKQSLAKKGMGLKRVIEILDNGSTWLGKVFFRVKTLKYFLMVLERRIMILTNFSFINYACSNH